MGSWGYDDDENDAAEDLWGDVLDCTKAKSADDLLRHQAKMFTCVRRVLRKERKSKRTEPEHAILGLILRCVKFIMWPNREQYMGGHIQNVVHGIERSLKRRQKLQLPRNFPSDLREIAAECARIMLERLQRGENRFRWSDVRERKLALKRAYGLFS